MHSRFRLKTSAVLAAGAMTLATTPVLAQYSANVFFSPTYPLTVGGYTEFAEAVEKATDGEIVFEVYAGGSLLEPAAGLSGVRDGIAQVGYHAGTYTPSELPLTNAIADLAFATPDPMAVAFASTEFNMMRDDMQQEWATNGVVYGGGYSTPPYNLICSDVVETLDDLDGKRVRVPGGAWDRFAEHVGMRGVNVPSSEMYTGLDRGTLDCAVNDPGALETFSLWDVAGSINTAPLGLYFSGVTWGYNQDFWRGLSDEHRRILLDEKARHIVRVQVHYRDGAEATLAEAEDRGVRVIDPSPDLQAALDEFNENDVNEIRRLATERFGVEDPDSLINDFNATVERWSELLEDVDRDDEDALIELVREEIYDRIDESSYGL